MGTKKATWEAYTYYHFVLSFRKKVQKNFPKKNKKVRTWKPDQNLDKGQDADDLLLQLRPQPQLD